MGLLPPPTPSICTPVLFPSGKIPMIKYSNNLWESLHLVKGYATNPLKGTDSQESGSQCVFIKESSYISGKNTQFWKLNLRENKSQGEKKSVNDIFPWCNRAIYLMHNCRSFFLKLNNNALFLIEYKCEDVYLYI